MKVIHDRVFGEGVVSLCAEDFINIIKGCTSLDQTIMETENLYNAVKDMNRMKNKDRVNAVFISITAKEPLDIEDVHGFIEKIADSFNTKIPICWESRQNRAMKNKYRINIFTAKKSARK